MCTLAIAWRVLADAPVVVAANRDERLDRPASPPATLDGDPRIVAPRDDEAGGTWLGYNEHGVLAGLSNRWTDAELAGERSRGQLVLDVLRAATAGEGAAAVEAAVGTHEYAAFNLTVADADRAVVLEWDGALRDFDLDPGVHAVLNAGWDDRFADVPGRGELVARQAESARRLRDRLAVGAGETADRWLDRAAAALADHDLGVCVHREGFGTRSSSLVALYADGGASYRFADGPPCETAYVDVDGET